MALIDTDLLDDLGLLLGSHGETSITDDCLWCVASGSARCPHQVASVIDGVVRLDGPLRATAVRLDSLPDRLARAVVLDGPRPVECRDLPGGDRLVAAAEAAWRPMSDAARCDPDVEGWTAVLVDRIRETYAGWLFGTLCTLSGGTLHRLDESGGGERWIAAEPNLLAAEIGACTRGEGSNGPFAGDPLCRTFGTASSRVPA